MVKAATTELTLLVPDEEQAARRWDEFAPVDVRELKTRTFNVVLDVAPKDGLLALKFRREKAEAEFLIEIFRDDLRVVAQLEHHIATVLDDRHAVIALFGELPDQGTVAVGNVDDLEQDSGEFEDATLDNAERTPRKLNQFNHVKASSVRSTDAI